MVIRGATAGGIAALVWGGLTASTGLEFGALAWLTGAAVGLSVRGSAPNARPLQRAIAAAIIAAASVVVGNVAFVLWLAHAHPLTMFRWIDLLWVAMAISAAEFAATRPVLAARSSGERSSLETAQRVRLRKAPPAANGRPSREPLRPARRWVEDRGAPGGAIEHAQTGQPTQS
jgi:hypothetical protein